MRRRDLLKTFGAAAGAAGMTRLLPGCGADGDGEEGITTIVLLMMENRSYDHFFGARSWQEGLPGDGLTGTETNPDSEGVQVPLWEATEELMCVPDPAHGWEASHTQYNGGLNDGFVTTHQEDHAGDLGPMQYLTRTHVPVSYALADNYAICDRWFCSLLGPTWPNRFYWLAGSSQGAISNDIPEGGFTTPTIFHRLLEAGIEHRYYYSDLPFLGVLGEVGLDLTRFLYYIDDFYSDAEQGRLPPVVYIDPPFTGADDHPPHHPIRGQEFIASIYNALAASPQWNNCLFVVTYDEHGGFYDHVAPPTAPDDRADQGFDRLGFRVPTLVAGPYVKQGHVSSVVRDHTSALRHIETMLGTEPLTARSSAAEDLSELLDLDRLAAGDPAPPIELPSFDVNEWTFDEICNASTLKPSKIDIAEYADAHPERMARWDRRAQLPEVMATIRRRSRR
jgi:phospholipase C